MQRIHDHIWITHDIRIDPRELDFSFKRSSGPGGQHVNKVSTAVQLRFNVAQSPSLSPEVRNRLIRIAGHRATTGGSIIIEAKSGRSQYKNRQEAIHRLVELIRKAAVRPRKRIHTRPGLQAHRRRLEAKKRQSQRKELRRKVTL